MSGAEHLEAAAGLGIAATWIVQAVRVSVPYLLAAVGGSFSERAGIPILGLEGFLLAGAFATATVTHATDSAWAGVGAALLAGLALAALHAFVSVRLGADAIVSGLAINMLCAGATRLGLVQLYGSAVNSPRVSSHGLPLPVIALAAVAASHVAQSHTPWGLRLRAAGENPRALEAVGLSPGRIRASGVAVCGAVAALGGAWLAFAQGNFSDGMSAGRGYIALAALIVGGWQPLGAAAAAFFFGAAETVDIRLQGGGAPATLVQLIPYVATVVVLAGWVGRVRQPPALGVRAGAGGSR